MFEKAVKLKSTLILVYHEKREMIKLYQNLESFKKKKKKCDKVPLYGFGSFCRENLDVILRVNYNRLPLSLPQVQPLSELYRSPFFFFCLFFLNTGTYSSEYLVEIC